ncbi:MAG: hypothetical protein IKE43_04635 [Coriobacteriales bacterium]|nr:hypothetical protein [Coriobacteriales bacterium]
MDMSLKRVIASIISLVMIIAMTPVYGLADAIDDISNNIPLSEQHDENTGQEEPDVLTTPVDTQEETNLTEDNDLHVTDPLPQEGDVPDLQTDFEEQSDSTDNQTTGEDLISTDATHNNEDIETTETEETVETTVTAETEETTDPEETTDTEETIEIEETTETEETEEPEEPEETEETEETTNTIATESDVQDGVVSGDASQEDEDENQDQTQDSEQNQEQEQASEQEDQIESQNQDINASEEQDTNENNLATADDAQNAGTETLDDPVVSDETSDQTEESGTEPEDQTGTTIQDSQEAPAEDKTDISDESATEPEDEEVVSETADSQKTLEAEDSSQDKAIEETSIDSAKSEKAGDQDKDKETAEDKKTSATEKDGQEKSQEPTKEAVTQEADKDARYDVVTGSGEEYNLYPGESASFEVYGVAKQVQAGSTVSTVIYTRAQAAEYVRSMMIDRVSEFTLTMYASDWNDTYFEKSELFYEDGNYLHGAYLRGCYAHVSWRWSTYTNSDQIRVTELSVVYTYRTTQYEEQVLMNRIDSVLTELGAWNKTTYYERLSVIYEYITNHVVYDYSSDGEKRYTAYAAMINGTSVCYGYALLLHLMLGRVGVPDAVILGDGNGEYHSWNIVQMDDGYWYNVDSTWDSQWVQADYNYQYFLQGDSQFNTKHTRDSEFATGTFYSAHPMGSGTYTPGSNDRIQISLANVYGDPQYYWTGAEQRPAIDVYHNGWLTEGIDYTVTYVNNINIGTAYVILTGIGRFIGTKTLYFEIIPIDLALVTIASVADKTYTGSAIKPSPKLTYNGTTLVKGTDYTVSYSPDTVNAGTVTITFTGKGHYSGTQTSTFSIVRADISSATVASIANKTYTGKAIRPVPTLTYNNKTLVNGTDFTLAYTKNINVGTASITVTGTGNYSGTKTVKFKIVSLSTTLTATVTAKQAPVGGTASATVSVQGADGMEVTYQWQYSTDAQSWSNSKLSGYNTQTVTYKNAQTKYYFRCKVTSADKRVAYTSPTKLTYSGWQKISGTWYYYNANCVQLTGWQKISGAWYYLRPSDGAMLTGWQKFNGSWYYFGGNGKMRTGWEKVSGSWYYFATSGKMQTGWIKWSGGWYLCATSGKMLTGWQKVGGYWYYLNPSSGKMKTGWLKLNGYWYFLNSEGKMHTGWLYLNDKQYFLDPTSGRMYTGWHYIDGYWYEFHATSGYRISW